MSADTPFLFLRHGETDWNRERRVQGQIDAPLNALGRAQAQAAAAALADRPIARIVSSPSSRARDTAEAVAARHGLPIAFDPELMEAHLGDHQGHLYTEALSGFWTGDYDPPGGETFSEFTERVWAAMTRARALGADTLIVAHGGLWRAARTRVRIEPAFSLPNAIPLAVTPAADIWRVETLLPLPPETIVSDAPAEDGSASKGAET